MKRCVATAVLFASMCFPVSTAVSPKRSPRVPLVESSFTVNDNIPDYGTNMSRYKFAPRSHRPTPQEDRVPVVGLLEMLQRYEDLFGNFPNPSKHDRETLAGLQNTHANLRMGWIEQNQKPLSNLFQEYAFYELQEVFGRTTSDTVIERIHPLNDLVFFLAATPHADQYLREKTVDYIKNLSLPVETKEGIVSAIRNAEICGNLKSNQGAEDPNVAIAIDVFGMEKLMERCD